MCRKVGNFSRKRGQPSGVCKEPQQSNGFLVFFDWLIFYFSVSANQKFVGGASSAI